MPDIFKPAMPPEPPEGGWPEQIDEPTHDSICGPLPDEFQSPRGSFLRLLRPAKREANQ